MVFIFVRKVILSKAWTVQAEKRPKKKQRQVRRVTDKIVSRRRRRRRLKGIHSRPDTNRTGAEGLSFYYPRLLHCLD